MKTALGGPIVCVLLLVDGSAFADDAAREALSQAEYRIKAACLYRFMQFIEWPKSTFINETSPLVLAVLGKDPFGEALDQCVKGKKIGGRDIVVKRFETLQDVGPCHLVFVSSSEVARLKDVVAALKPFHAATVSELEEFTKEGGIFRFLVSEKKVKFEINMNAAKEAGIEIRSQLRRVGK